MLPSCTRKIYFAFFPISNILLQIGKIVANCIVPRLDLFAQFLITTFDSVAVNEISDEQPYRELHSKLENSRVDYAYRDAESRLAMQ
jgi:hypothetical protein